MLVWNRASFYIKNKNISDLLFLHKSSSLTNIYNFPESFLWDAGTGRTLSWDTKSDLSADVGQSTSQPQTYRRMGGSVVEFSPANHKPAHQLQRTMLNFQRWDFS